MTTRSSSAPVGDPPYVGLLPETATARGGCVFYPRRDFWNLREGTYEAKLWFSELRQLTPEFLVAFKMVLVWYAENRSAQHVSNLFYRNKALFEFKSNISQKPISEITDLDLLNYKGEVGAEREWYLGTLSGFLEQWALLGQRGITKAAVALLGQLRLKGNPKGVAVATMDPATGPLTAIELEAVQAAFNDAYGRFAVSLDDYVLCWILMALGQRPKQYAALKVCDIKPVPAGDGSLTYVLSVPRAKTGSSDPRAEFKDRVLSPDLGPLVMKQAAQVKERFAGLLLNKDDAPLFPGEWFEGSVVGYEYHQTAKQLSQKVIATLGKLRVKSERTGSPIHIGAKRFRTTIGTRAAEEGYGELVIAELLDHSDTQNVGVYVRATPAIIARIDRALAMYMARMAQAFAGTLIEGPEEASRADDPNSRIRAPAITGNFDAISSCGRHGFCGFLKPIACYTCKYFEPWLDGPHEQVLEHLLAERERLFQADRRLACINDRTILAVAEVIQCCEVQHAEKKQPRS
ncbi:site-specific integrase [Ralstonia sp. Ralssp110]|uniref:site-specific integrase n=1 Tax=Ralstonia sp. Ralssp110 TaxID=3243004 RepID=UPI0039B41C6D